MKTIDNRRILGPFGVILKMVLFCCLIFGLRLWLTEYEFFINLFLFTLALSVLWVCLVGYPLVSSKSNSSLIRQFIGPFTLIIAASVLLGLYDDWPKMFLDAIPSNPERGAELTRLAVNAKVLGFVVPAILLAVAANIITKVIHSEECNSDKSLLPNPQVKRSRRKAAQQRSAAEKRSLKEK